MTFGEKLLKLNNLEYRLKSLLDLYQCDITNSFSEETMEQKLNITSEINQLLKTLTEEEYELYASEFSQKFNRGC